jgi:hydroxymethylglutaryl-CoA lyase
MEINILRRGSGIQFTRIRKRPIGYKIKSTFATSQTKSQFYSRNTNPHSKDTTAVRILEVGPRDGLQNIKKIVPTATKVELIRRLFSTGLNAIEATSFISPKWIPQLADGSEVLKQVLPLAQKKDISIPVLVPNLKGLEGAIRSGAKEVTVFVSATEGFSIKNTNCNIAKSIKRAQEVAESALKHDIAVRG